MSMLPEEIKFLSFEAFNRASILVLSLTLPSIVPFGFSILCSPDNLTMLLKGMFKSKFKSKFGESKLDSLSTPELCFFSISKLKVLISRIELELFLFLPLENNPCKVALVIS